MSLACLPHRCIAPIELVYTGHYTPILIMGDRYVPPVWRDRGRPTSSSSTRGSSGQADDRELSTHAGRNQARGRGAMRAPDFSGTSRWQNTENTGRSSGGDIWSSLPASNVHSSSSRDEPGLRKSNPSTSSYRPTPTRFSNEDRTTRSAIQARPSPSTSVPPHPNSGDARSWKTRPPPSTPVRPAAIPPSISLSSPSTDLQPISSSHRAFKKLDEMEMLGTLSRSGGNGDGEGDGLLDRDIQEKFLRWIEEKVGSHSSQSYPSGAIAITETYGHRSSVRSFLHPVPFLQIR
jgi:hypothetical protein